VGAAREVTLKATSGIRRLDVLTKFGKEIESKVGLTGLTKTTATQMQKDLELLFDPKSPVRELEWQVSRVLSRAKGADTCPSGSALTRSESPYV
jgi:hypothetical protein